MFKYRKFLTAICCVFLWACNGTKNKPLSIGFSADSSVIVIRNIDPVGLLQLKDHLATDTVYQTLVSVLQTPGDDDFTGREIDWPGVLSLKGNELLFTPKEPFEKGKSYLVATMVNASFSGVEDFIKDKGDYRVKAQEQVLKR